MNPANDGDLSSDAPSGIMEARPPKKSLFRRVQRVLVAFGALYVLAVALLAVPFFQRQFRAVSPSQMSGLS